MLGQKADQIKSAIAAGIIVLLILTAVAIVIKYSEEGENNMPFKLSKIVIGSMVVSEDTEISSMSTENSIIQNNGVYIEIKKNENYKKQEIIKSVDISNIQIIKKPIKGEVKVYLPSTVEDKKFIYSDQYILEDDYFKYLGASKSDTTTLEINNQGGVIALAFGNTNLGKYTLSTEGLTIDGTMLNDMGITDEDIKFTVNFDLTIETEKNKFKANMTLDMPAGDITKEGISSVEITDTEKYIFKRIRE